LTPDFNTRSTGKSGAFAQVRAYKRDPSGGVSPQKVLSRNAEVVIDDRSDPVVVAAVADTA
jgi:hypothetical protein